MRSGKWSWWRHRTPVLGAVCLCLAAYCLFRALGEGHGIALESGEPMGASGYFRAAVIFMVGGLFLIFKGRLIK